MVILVELLHHIKVELVEVVREQQVELVDHHHIHRILELPVDLVEQDIHFQVSRHQLLHQLFQHQPDLPGHLLLVQLVVLVVEVEVEVIVILLVEALVELVVEGQEELACQGVMVQLELLVLCILVEVEEDKEMVELLDLDLLVLLLLNTIFDTLTNILHNNTENIIQVWHFNQFGISQIYLKM
jgi:hypothetical protein